MRQYELIKLSKKLREKTGALYNFSLNGEKLEGQFINIYYDNYSVGSYDIFIKKTKIQITLKTVSSVIDFIENNIPDDLQTNLNTIKKLYPLFT